MAVRQRRGIGVVLKVPLGDQVHCYAWTLPEADFVLFDLLTGSDVPVIDVVKHPIAFRVAVNGSAYLDGRWLRVGKSQPSPHLLAPVPKFMQDVLTGRFKIYLGGEIRPAKLEECVGLERCAVWSPEQVEDRLRDHFAGRVNKWVKSLAIDASYSSCSGISGV